jgi:GNAT superfamily N-acetyltransferase
VVVAGTVVAIVNTGTVISVRPAYERDLEGCVQVLEQLPDYFTPDTHDAVRSAIPSHRVWVATDDETDDDVVGFLLAERRYPVAAEITFAAVTPERQGRGIGTQLVEHAVTDLGASGVLVVEVKTLDESAGYEPYVATRAFWEARGFVQIDCIDPLPGWQPGNPSAIYVAALAVTR